MKQRTSRIAEESLSCLEKGAVLLPSPDHLSWILQNCKKACKKEAKNATNVVRLHAHMSQNGLQSHPIHGNYIILMLIHVGKLSCAHHVYHRLPHPNTSSWNALIIANVKAGKLQHALLLFHEMQRYNSVKISAFALLSLAKCCANLRNLQDGIRIHTKATKMGLLDKDPFVGSALVDMYAKCDSLTRAQKVFDKIKTRDVVAWTSLISGYADHDDVDKAINCFELMQLEGVKADRVIFVCILRACACVGDMDRVQEIHEDIERNGLLGKDLVLGTALVGIYAKHGFLAQARFVFDKLRVRDVVSWTALMLGYAEHGHNTEAIDCFENMQLDAISPDAITFVCSLKACSNLGAIGKVEAIHCQIEKEELLEKDLSIGTALVDAYAKCGSFSKAQQVFDSLLVHDDVSWTALISGYVGLGYAEKALRCFEQMQLEGISPNDVTFACILKACAILGNISQARRLYSHIKRKGLLENDSVGIGLVDMYAKCGSLWRAQTMFDKLRFRNVVSWNAIISGYTEHGLAQEALNYFELMELEGVPPDSVTYICSLRACANIGAMRKGEEIHAQMESVETDIVVGNSLINMYAKFGMFGKANNVFDKLSVRNVVSWTSLIAGYYEHGLNKQALRYFEAMQCEGISPNNVTFSCILKACGNVDALGMGKEIHSEIERKGILDTDVSNSLVDMYIKYRLFKEAEHVFDKLLVRDRDLWISLIAGYTQIGDMENVLIIFYRMLKEGIQPCRVIFQLVLRASSQRHLVKKDYTFAEAMSADFGTPDFYIINMINTEVKNIEHCSMPWIHFVLLDFRSDGLG